MPSKASLRSSPSTLSTMHAGGAELCRRARCVRSYCGKLRCGVYRAGRQWQTVDAPCCSLLLLGLRVNDDDEERPPAAAGQREAVLVTAAMVQRRTHARDAAGGGGWLAGSPLFSRDILLQPYVWHCGNGAPIAGDSLVVAAAAPRSGGPGARARPTECGLGRPILIGRLEHALAAMRDANRSFVREAECAALHYFGIQIQISVL